MFEFLQNFENSFFLKDSYQKECKKVSSKKWNLKVKMNFERTLFDLTTLSQELDVFGNLKI